MQYMFKFECFHSLIAQECTERCRREFYTCRSKSAKEFTGLVHHLLQFKVTPYDENHDFIIFYISIDSYCG